MEISAEEQGLLWKISFDLFPPLVRTDVMSDPEFRKDTGLTSEALIYLAGDDLYFHRSGLFSVVRAAYADFGKDFTISSVNGNEWSVMAEEGEGVGQIRFSREDKNYLFDLFWALTPYLEKRLERFERVSRRCGFSKQSHDHWHEVLSYDTVLDDDVGDLLEDISMSPDIVIEQIKSELRLGKSSISSLVPPREHYFERLVGEYCSSKDIYNYSQNEIAEYLNILSLSERPDSLLWALMISSHSSIPLCLESHDFDISGIEDCCEYLSQYGDPFSCVAAVELGLSVLDRYPKLDGCLERLVQKLFDNNIDKLLRLLVALIKLVDGELSRLQLFKGKPPFYRKLASIAQASLVARCAVVAGVEFDSLAVWAGTQREMIFYCRSFIDLRSEPRWSSNYLTPEQLQSELLSRVHNASQLNSGSIVSTSFRKLLFSVGDDTVSGRISLHSFLPGPLEGNTQPSEVPPDIASVIEHALAEGVPTPESFAALVNSAQYWEVDPRFTELALKALADAKHQLSRANSQDDIIFTLTGLAKLASVSKNTDLAYSLSILARKYRDYLDVNSQPENLLAIGLVAAASFDDSEEWAKYIGGWANEMAYLPLEPEAGIRLREWIRQLSVLEPLLYASAGRALAALDSFHN